MAASAPATTQSIRPGGFDPLRWAWQLLTNVKFALFLVGTAGVAGMIGVVLPQLPGPMRSNPAAREAWYQLQAEDFGAFTEPMRRFDLFEVFYSPWFNGLWVVIVIAVTVCTVSRFSPTWRAVHRPSREVSDRYFETAHHHASFTHEGGASAIEAELRRRKYRIERVGDRDGATYFFAERFQWSHYGTFLSHLALLMLLIGGFLTHFAGFNNTVIIAETAPPFPVFADAGPGQIFVKVLDAHRGLDENGNIVDYRSQLEVRQGNDSFTCTTTVNDPCRAFGYSIHQAAFFDDFAALRILGLDGRVLFDDIVDFSGEANLVPHFTVSSPSGVVLFDEDLPQMATDRGASDSPQDDFAIAQLTVDHPSLAEPLAYGVAWRTVDGELVLALRVDGASRQLRAGESVTDPAGYRISFDRAAAIPTAVILDVPGATSADGVVTVQMPNGEGGQPYLLVDGIDSTLIALPIGAEVETSSGHAFTFGGRVEASGVSVKRDPGDLFIWLAVGMAIVGLAITFYVPRRRLWVKVTPQRTYLAGIAEKTTRFGREMRFIGASLGSRDALTAEDQAETY
ncbi:MAG: cytochrome c biogenesis protein ResB [Tepidiformaceae bacterium]